MKQHIHPSFPAVITAFLIAGCTSGYKAPGGATPLAPVPRQKVAILQSFPDSSTYKVIGNVAAGGAALATKESVYAKLQKCAADLGADAVIVSSASREHYADTDFGPLYGWKMTGMAIKYVGAQPPAGSMPPRNTKTARPPSQDRLLGHWVSTVATARGGQTGEFTFSPNGGFVFAINGRNIGIPSDMSYSINAGSYPWEVDCLNNNKKTGQINTIRMLVEMIDDNTIRAAFNFPQPTILPRNFTASNLTVFVMQRSK